MGGREGGREGRTYLSQYINGGKQNVAPRAQLGYLPFHALEHLGHVHALDGMETARLVESGTNGWGREGGRE
jgi:hypothetical protein